MKTSCKRFRIFILITKIRNVLMSAGLSKLHQFCFLLSTEYNIIKILTNCLRKMTSFFLKKKYMLICFSTKTKTSQIKWGSKLECGNRILSSLKKTLNNLNLTTKGYLLQMHLIHALSSFQLIQKCNQHHRYCNNRMN